MENVRDNYFIAFYHTRKNKRHGTKFRQATLL